MTQQQPVWYTYEPDGRQYVRGIYTGAPPDDEQAAGLAVLEVPGGPAEGFYRVSNGQLVSLGMRSPEEDAVLIERARAAKAKAAKIAQEKLPRAERGRGVRLDQTSRTPA